MSRLFAPIVCLLAAASCDAPPAAEVKNSQVVALESNPGTQSVDPVVAQEVVDELEGWDGIIEVLHDESLAVQWVIGVKDDGSKRYGLAESVCMELADRGLQLPDTSVRIVDLPAVMANGGDFRAASLGSVRCENGQWVDP